MIFLSFFVFLYDFYFRNHFYILSIMEKKNFAMSATLAKPIKVKGISNK